MASTKPKRRLAVVKTAAVEPAGLAEITMAERAGRNRNDSSLRELPIDQVKRNSNQPRELSSKGFSNESLAALAETISTQGVIQPIVVRPTAQGYEIVAGERRWRAAQIAGLAAIPAVIRDVDDKVMRLMALVENLQREDLNPMEEASALDAIKRDGDYTNDQLGKMIGRAKSTITVTLSLLRLTPQVQALVRDRELDPSLARSLANLPDGQQVEMAQRAVAERWSARRMEYEKAQLNDSNEKQSGILNSQSNDPDIAELASSLSQLYGVPISIKLGSNGQSGKITINYASLDECDGILTRMGYQRNI